MEEETWTYNLSKASRISRLKSHLELFIDFDDIDEDDELKTAYPCPLCPEDFDLLELCFHIDEEHPIEAKSGICPVCATWVGTNMVGHITTQHGNLLKISFLSLLLEIVNLLTNRYFYSLHFCLLFARVSCCFNFSHPFFFLVLGDDLLIDAAYCLTQNYSQHKLRCRKLESYPTLSYSRKDLDDGRWHFSTAGSSHAVSNAKAPHDPFVSFIYSAPTAVECENVQPDSSSELTIEERHPDETLSERHVQPSMSGKDQIEKAQRSKFVQGILLSTILDPDSD